MKDWLVSEKIENYGNPVLEKSFSFGVRVVKFYSSKIKINYHNKDLFRQLLRSGTSIGANITEAQEAASKKDFINKLAIALKEAKETEYWLKLLNQSSVIEDSEFTDLYNHCQELIRLLVSILKKLKAV
ncbi:MAG: four helix bundle protein [Ignavibacteria bacterium]|nr:four helix bundle protein [Ignavibacteria bacterium]